MDLDTIEASLERTLGCSGIFLGHLLDLLNSQWLWRSLGVGRAVKTIAADWNITGTDGAFAAEEGGSCSTSNVPELTVDKTAFSMYGIRDAFPTIDLGLREDARNTGITSSL